MRGWVFIATLLLVESAWAGGADAPPKVRRYGTRVSAPEGQTVTYPDFWLTYLGKHGPTRGDIPILFFDYELEGSSGKKTTSYSTLGMIAPHPFCFEGRSYLLERDDSEKLGRLADDEIVVWKDPRGTGCKQEKP